MGTVSVDTQAAERKYEVQFPMHTREGIETFLEQMPYIQSSMYLTGDYDALILILDFKEALAKSKLSKREQTAIEMVYIQDMKRVDVAKHFDVTKQTVQNWVKRATEKLAKYYEEMGGYSD